VVFRRQNLITAVEGHYQSFYHVNGLCTCPASTHRDEVCKHRLGLRLSQKVTGRLVDAQRRTAPPAPALPPEAFTTIQGKPFVRFEGLLALAHERGLVELTTTMVSVTADLAVCQVTAVFRDGSRYIDIGDDSPDNVAKHLRPHFVRMPGTRAAARALRRALNISAVAARSSAPRPENNHTHGPLKGGPRGAPHN
jgi:hypothetical protein